MHRNPVSIVVAVALLPVAFAAGDAGLDPCGKIHIPIGIANSLDTLKTFVEAEGCFSPGVGSYGVYFWLPYIQTTSAANGIVNNTSKPIFA